MSQKLPTQNVQSTHEKIKTESESPTKELPQVSHKSPTQNVQSTHEKLKTESESPTKELNNSNANESELPDNKDLSKWDTYFKCLVNYKQSGSGIWKCRLCHYQSKTESKALEHVELSHPPENFTGYRCDHCDSISLTRLRLRSHQSTYHGNTPAVVDGNTSINDLPSGTNENISPAKSVLYMFRCKFCKTVFKFRSDLHKHLREFHSLSFKDKRRYSCSYCNFCCYKEDEIQLHLRVKHRKGVETKSVPMKSLLKSSQKQTYSCRVCGLQFPDQKLQEAHLKEEEGFKFKCNYCESFFKSETTFKEHLLECSSEEEDKEESSGDANLFETCSSLLDILDF